MPAKRKSNLSEALDKKEEMTKSVYQDKIYDDSSDEEEIDRNNNEFRIKIDQEFIEQISRNLNMNHDYQKEQIVNSIILHNLGRMIIFSPEIDDKYRILKNQYLKKNETLIQEDSGEKKIRGLIDLDKIISTKSLSDILVIGRLTRRSQIRISRALKKENSDEEYVVRTSLTISSRNDSDIEDGRISLSKSLVTEDLAVSSKGLSLVVGRSDFVLFEPKCNYKSIAKDIKKLYNYYNFNRFEDSLQSYKNAASKELEELSKEKETKNSETIDDIKKNQKLAQSLKDNSYAIKNKISAKYETKNGDIFIGESIKKICKSEAPLDEVFYDDQIKKFNHDLYSLTYLLFKTEVFRSPAALINNMQMIDLIINSKMSLSEALIDNEMPMSARNSVKAARRLNEFYNSQNQSQAKTSTPNSIFYKYNNPFEYAYDFGEPDKDKIKSLIKRESNLMDKWLKFRIGDQAFEELKQDKTNYVPIVTKEIYGLMQDFGLNITESQAFFNSFKKYPASQPSNSPSPVAAISKNINNLSLTR